MPPAESVIPFQLDHDFRAVDARGVAEAFAELAAWRRILRATGFIGHDVDRYDGYAYGNLSARIGEPGGGGAFLITGSQTSGLSEFAIADCALVERWNIDTNQVTSYGQSQPSSEALSHAAAYDCASQLRAVLHVHSPELWQSARALALPITDPEAANGTPAMARAIERCWGDGLFEERDVLAMGGHEDGILACGLSMEAAGLGLLAWLGRAIAPTAEQNEGTDPPSGG